MAPRPTPGLLRPVAKLPVRPSRYAGRFLLTPDGLQRLPDGPVQSGVLRQPEHVVHPVRLTPSHQRLPGEARVAADPDLHLRPVAPDLVHDPRHLLHRPGRAVLRPTEVDEHPSRPLLDDGDHVEIEGLITRFASTTDFDVSGQAVVTTAGTEFEGGAAGVVGGDLDGADPGVAKERICLGDVLENDPGEPDRRTSGRRRPARSSTRERRRPSSGRPDRMLRSV